MDDVHFRPAVRILCLDAADRVLMMCWRDPVDGHRVWEPPGGGIESGETPLQAAQRELAEETGLDSDRIVHRHTDVHRDVWWKGKHFVGPEQFFVARFDGDRPPLRFDGLMVDEQQNIQEYAWLDRSEFASVDGDLEPPELADLIVQLAGPA